MGIFNFFKRQKNENWENTADLKINQYLVFVMSMINDLIDNQFGCNRRMLKDNGAIFYMNGQNGTKFDWDTNEHVSPFYCYYKNGKGAIKFIINKDGTAVAYYYLNGKNEPCNNTQTEFSEKTAKDIAVLMYTISDCRGLFDQPLNNLEFTYNCTENDVAEFDRNIVNKSIIDNRPEILIIDNNKENESMYIDTYNYFIDNKQSIINKLKETYIEYQEIVDKDFVMFSIEGINKQEFISEDKFDDNQNLYLHTPLGDFVDKYNDNATFLKIQCGAEEDDDTFSFAFINCNTKETMYLFHRF